MRDAVGRALVAYQNTEAWETLQRRCMQQDFSWSQPVEEYIMLYRKLLEQRGGADIKQIAEAIP